MISYEKNIESMYREPVYATGGGTRRTAWDIEWQDEPFAASDTAGVSPLKLPSLHSRGSAGSGSIYPDWL